MYPAAAAADIAAVVAEAGVMKSGECGIEGTGSTGIAAACVAAATCCAASGNMPRDSGGGMPAELAGREAGMGAEGNGGGIGGRSPTDARGGGTEPRV